MEALITFIKRIMSKLKELVKEAIDLFKRIEEEVEKDTTTPEPEVPIAPEPTEPEIERNIIAEFEPYTGTPVVIPATEDNSFVDDEGEIVPFTIRIPLLLKEDDGSLILSKSERNVGTEWMLRQYKGNLHFEMTNNSNRDTIRKIVPLSELPKELFMLHILVDNSKDTSGIGFFINARKKEGSHIGSSSFSGIEKTDAPIRFGGNGWDSNLFNGETGGETIIEKGRLWSPIEMVEDVQKFFGIDDLLLKPNEEGNYDIDVEPNTGEDKSDELREEFARVPSGEETASKVVMTEGRYLVDMLGSVSQSAIDVYTKSKLDIDFDKVVLYTTRPSITDLSSRVIGKRLQVNVEESNDISISNLTIEGSLGQDTYEKALEQEHGISNDHSYNLNYKNIEVKNVWGDGMYFAECENVSLTDIVTDGTNRQGIGIGSNVKNLKIDNYTALNCIRADIDLEGDFLGHDIDGVEVTNSYLPAHTAAVGNSRINNVNFHHNKLIRTIIMKGSMWTSNPEYNSELPESESNPTHFSIEPRENWVIEDNEKIGHFGTPMAMVRIRYCKNVKVNRNNIVVPVSQGRWGISLNYCSGRIEIMNNGYENPCINRILNCKVGTEVIIDEPNNDNIYIIEIDGVKEVRGTNPELLALIEKKGY